MRWPKSSSTDAEHPLNQVAQIITVVMPSTPCNWWPKSSLKCDAEHPQIVVHSTHAASHDGDILGISRTHVWHEARGSGVQHRLMRK